MKITKIKRKASLTPAFVGCFPRPLRQNRVNGRKTLFSNVSKFLLRPSKYKPLFVKLFGKFQNRELRKNP